MKKNTQKLLLAIYKNSQEGLPHHLARGVNEVMTLVSPTLSTSGARSLVYLLEKKGYISTQRLLGTTQLSLTTIGKRLLEADFPALDAEWDSWNGSFDCLVFLQPPAGDPQFRYLRKLLLEERALSLTRGVYISAKNFSPKVLQELRSTYHRSVTLFTIGSWEISVENAVIMSGYSLIDVIESYSGISKEIDRLLSAKKLKKALRDSDKKQIALVYDRLHATLASDPGFSSYYFPHAPRGRLLLEKLTELLYGVD